jgi:hypothetical protein
LEKTAYDVRNRLTPAQVVNVKNAISAHKIEEKLANQLHLEVNNLF